MAKNKCGQCDCSEGAMYLGKDLFETIKRHIEGNTSQLEVSPKMCQDCLYELFLDTQWDTGWQKRADFFYRVIVGLYELGPRVDAKKKALSVVMTIGTAALSSMCIDCNGNVDHSLNKKDMPGWLRKANDAFLSKYVPKRDHKDYGNMLCGKCISSTEKKVIQAIRDEDLPLHVHDEWITEKAAVFFEKRLKGTNKEGK